MKKFIGFDWETMTGSEQNAFEIERMKETEEGKDGNFIWESVSGGFYVFDTWADYEIWQNQN